MKKILFGLLFISSLFALEFEVENFERNPKDFHGHFHPVEDMNADNCAVLYVECDVDGELYLEEFEKFKEEQGY